MNYLLVLLILLALFGCKNKNESHKKILNEFEKINGIGPVTEPITLQEINIDKVNAGKIIFQNKCISCHKLDDTLAGPPLRKIIEIRTPEYILNMIVNPVDMTLFHPVARNLATKLGSQMTNQNVSLNDALNILDYLRYENKIGKKEKK